MVMRWLRLGSVRLFSVSLAVREQCRSCGVELQSVRAGIPGFYVPRREVVPVKGAGEVLREARNLLFSQDLEALKQRDLDRPDTSVVGVEEYKRFVGRLKHELVCQRCNDALYHMKYRVNDFTSESLQNVLENVPKHANLVHTVPFAEFPLHLDMELLRNRNYNTSLLLTKADQLISKSGVMNDIVPQFLNDFVKYHLRLNNVKVSATSAVRNWKMQDAYTNLKKYSFLIGNPNTGKSSFLNNLAKRHPSYRVTFKNDQDLEKLVIEDKSTPRTQLEDLSETHNATGVSFIPNLTKVMRGFKIDKKLLFDLPGYSNSTIENENYPPPVLEDLIQSDALNQIRNTETINSKTSRKKAYYSIKGTKGGGCYTLGGIFYWVPPPDTINQFTKNIPGQMVRMNSIDKALQVFKECNSPLTDQQSHPFKKFCTVTSKLCEKSAFQRYIIPPFIGSIEVVLRDIGFFTIKTTGKYRYEGLHEVWVPKGVEVCVREPLEKLMVSNYFMEEEKRDSFQSGNFLKDIPLESASKNRGGDRGRGGNKKKPMKRWTCPIDRPIISSCYPMENEETDILKKMKEIYLERTEKDLSSRRHIKVDPLEILNDPDNKHINLYWYYKF